MFNRTKTFIYFPFLLKPAAPITLLAVNQERPSSLAVDSDAVYWTKAGAVMALYKNESEPILLASGLAGPDFLIEDDGFLYWLSCLYYPDYKFTIFRMPKSGGQPLELITYESWWSGFAVDETYVYYRIKDYSVMRLPKSGGVPEPAPVPALLFDGSDAYWLNSNNEFIRSGKDGSSAKILMKLSGGRENSTVDVTAIFPRTSGIYFTVFVNDLPGWGSCTDQHTTLVKISRNGDEVEWAGFAPGYAEALVVEPYIYFSGACTDGILKTLYKSNMWDWLVKWPEGARDMAEDEANIYWADIENGWIKRAGK